MANVPSKLTVEQQLLVSTVADEITETTSIHQQAIVRMLAVASEHDLNAANLLQDLGVEMKSATARKIPFVVEDLKAGLSVEAALARTPGVVPESTVMALAVAQSRGLKKPMNHTLLNTTNKRESEDTNAESFDSLDQISKLVQKYIFVLSILSFLMLFIIPQFKDMFEEFGIDLPASMITLIQFANFVTQYWFVFALVLMGVGGYVIFHNPRILTNYFTRWIPNRWQQPVLTKRAQKDLSAAWVIQASDDLPGTAMQFVEDNGIEADEFKRLAGTEKFKSSTGVSEVLADKRVISKRASTVASTASSRESAAWILRKMNKEDQSNRRQRGLAGLRTSIWMANFFAMAIGGWVAIAIFQSLLDIIRGLTGYA